MNTNISGKGTIDVPYVANLARLQLDEEEVVRFQSQLGQIVAYVQQIEELDVSEVEPTSHAVSVTNVFRPDAVGESLAQEQALRIAPETIEGHFKVPKIVDSN